MLPHALELLKRPRKAGRARSASAATRRQSAQRRRPDLLVAELLEPVMSVPNIPRPWHRCS
jgi:hypothetical protein